MKTSILGPDKRIQRIPPNQPKHYWHPLLGLCHRHELESYYRDVLKLPNWKVS